MLDKAIEHGKEFRKPYYKKAPSSDKTCRCHGSCPRCYDNRMYKIQKINLYAINKILYLYINKYLLGVDLL